MNTISISQDFLNFAFAMLLIIAVAYYAYVIGFLFDETKQISKRRFWLGMIPFLLWGVVLIELYYANFYGMLPTVKQFNNKIEKL
jgi:cell shape-determining protein MreD